MSEAERDVENLTDYLMRATHGQLVTVAAALARELLWRGVSGDVEAAEAARLVRSGHSAPRAEPFGRPGGRVDAL